MFGTRPAIILHTFEFLHFWYPFFRVGLWIQMECICGLTFDNSRAESTIWDRSWWSKLISFWPLASCFNTQWLKSWKLNFWETLFSLAPMIVKEHYLRLFIVFGVVSFLGDFEIVFVSSFWSVFFRGMKFSRQHKSVFSRLHKFRPFLWQTACWSKISDRFLIFSNFCSLGFENTCYMGLKY